jgi:rod shape-determining protein MreB
LCGDIYERGIVLTGGGALLRRVSDHLRDQTGLPIIVADDPLATVVIGAGKLLNDRDLLLKLSVN